MIIHVFVETSPLLVLTFSFLHVFLSKIKVLLALFILIVFKKENIYPQSMPAVITTFDCGINGAQYSMPGGVPLRER